MKNCWKISLVLILFSLTQVKGQDPVFSQFYQAQSSINPALAGMFQGEYKLSVSYRDQWYSLLGFQSSYKTAFASFNYKFNPEAKNIFTLGGMLIQDSAGEGSFKQVRGYLSSSYNMQLSQGSYNSLSHYLSIGMQLGIGQNTLEWGNLWFGRQFDIPNLQVNTSLPSDEPIPTDQNYNTSVYPDLNIGLAWSGIATKKFSTHAGISVSHINTPSISNYGSIYDKYLRRLSLNAGAKILLNSDLGVLPAAVFYAQGPSRLLIIGSSFSYSLLHLNESGFRVGTYARIANSINGTNLEGLIVSAMFEKQNLQIGVSYDFTLSGLRLAANALGGFELSISYINPEGADFDNPRIAGF